MVLTRGCFAWLAEQPMVVLVVLHGKLFGRKNSRACSLIGSVALVKHNTKTLIVKVNDDYERLGITVRYERLLLEIELPQSCTG